VDQGVEQEPQAVRLDQNADEILEAVADYCQRISSPASQAEAREPQPG
jgi:hypothetical protein